MTVPAGSRRAAFLDRDGIGHQEVSLSFRSRSSLHISSTVNKGCHVDAAEALAFEDGRGLYTESDLDALTDWMKQRFLESGAPLAGVYYCPHHPTEAVGIYRRECSCRKPAPGMLLAAAHDLGIDLASSIMFGDKTSDLEAARVAGVPVRLLLGTDACALPPVPATRGLAGAVYRGLLDATADAALLAPPGSLTAASG